MYPSMFSSMSIPCYIFSWHLQTMLTHYSHSILYSFFLYFSSFHMLILLPYFIKSKAWVWKFLSGGWLFVTPWTEAHQSPPSTEFSRQEYWSGLPCPSPGDLPNPGIEPRFPVLQADSIPSEPPGKPKYQNF